MKPVSVSDGLWIAIESLLPTYQPSIKGGRPRLKMKEVFNGILFVKANKLPWRAASEQLGSKTTLNDYYRECAKSGFFHSLKETDLLSKGELAGIDFDWDRIDSLYSNSTAV